MRTLRTWGARKENTPARTVRVTSFPFTMSRMVAGSLTRKRSLRKESARNVGATVSMRNEHGVHHGANVVGRGQDGGVLAVLQTGRAPGNGLDSNLEVGGVDG